MKWTNDCEIYQFSKQNFGFPNRKNSSNSLTFQIVKFQKFPKSYNFKKRQFFIIGKIIK